MYQGLFNSLIYLFRLDFWPLDESKIAAMERGPPIFTSSLVVNLTKRDLRFLSEL